MPTRAFIWLRRIRADNLFFTRSRNDKLAERDPSIRPTGRAGYRRGRLRHGMGHRPGQLLQRTRTDHAPRIGRAHLRLAGHAVLRPGEPSPAAGGAAVLHTERYGG